VVLLYYRHGAAFPRAGQSFADVHKAMVFALLGDAAAGSEVTAYEIHAGQTRVAPDAPRLFAVLERAGAPTVDADGVASASGNVAGTYLHGLFANDALRGALLRHLAAHAGRAPDPRWGASRGDPYERLARVVGAALDLQAVARLAGLAVPRA